MRHYKCYSKEHMGPTRGVAANIYAYGTTLFRLLNFIHSLEWYSRKMLTGYACKYATYMPLYM